MPKIILSPSAGFCFGVSRAVDEVYKQIDEKKKNVYTYGPIIHNEYVVEDLKSKGVDIAEDLNLLKGKKDATLIIRSHGVSRAVYNKALESGASVVDATCPFVKKIHNIVSDESKKGNMVIIVGDPTHPEVIGIKGWGDASTRVISGIEDFEKLNIPKSEHIAIVAQTTFNYSKFQECVEKIEHLGYDIQSFNTVCNATKQRQLDARSIAKEVDVMIVIGSRNSSNTQKLYNICSEVCERTYLIQSSNDLAAIKIASEDTVGITAGASTPKHIIEEVQNYVRSEF